MSLPSPSSLRRFAAALTTLIAGAALAASTPGAVVPSAWQHHHEKLWFYNFGTKFTCNALEGEIRRILFYLGARADAQVHANCPRGPYLPDPEAQVEVDFYSLAPIEGSVSGAGPVVEGRWAPMSLAPRHPIFMEESDCYLVENLKPLLTRTFIMRDAVYKTDCIPHDRFLVSYDVQAVMLQPVPPSVAAPELGNH